MTYKIDDKRTDDRRPLGYMVATDTFLSGWGEAPGRSLFAVAVYEAEEADTIEANMQARSDMSRPRWVSKLRADGTPAVRLHAGDHLSVVDRSRAAPFYRVGTFT